METSAATGRRRHGRQVAEGRGGSPPSSSRGSEPLRAEVDLLNHEVGRRSPTPLQHGGIVAGAHHHPLREWGNVPG